MNLHDAEAEKQANSINPPGRIPERLMTTIEFNKTKAEQSETELLIWDVSGIWEQLLNHYNSKIQTNTRKS